MFDQFDDNNDDFAMKQTLTNNDIKERLKKIMKEAKSSNKASKKVRKLRKKVRKLDKLVRRKFGVGERSVKKSDTNQNDKKCKEKDVNERKLTEKGEKSFLKRLGDTFLKVIPNLLTTAITLGIKLFFERNTKNKQRGRIVVA